jgi:hypothetical protein
LSETISQQTPARAFASVRALLAACGARYATDDNEVALRSVTEGNVELLVHCAKKDLVEALEKRMAPLAAVGLANAVVDALARVRVPLAVDDDDSAESLGAQAIFVEPAEPADSLAAREMFNKLRRCPVGERSYFDFKAKMYATLGSGNERNEQCAHFVKHAVSLLNCVRGGHSVSSPYEAAYLLIGVNDDGSVAYDVADDTIMHMTSSAISNLLVAHIEPTPLTYYFLFDFKHPRSGKTRRCGLLEIVLNRRAGRPWQVKLARSGAMRDVAQLNWTRHMASNFACPRLDHLTVNHDQVAYTKVKFNTLVQEYEAKFDSAHNASYKQREEFWANHVLTLYASIRPVELQTLFDVARRNIRSLESEPTVRILIISLPRVGGGRESSGTSPLDGDLCAQLAALDFDVVLAVGEARRVADNSNLERLFRSDRLWHEVDASSSVSSAGTPVLVGASVKGEMNAKALALCEGVLKARNVGHVFVLCLFESPPLGGAEVWASVVSHACRVPLSARAADDVLFVSICGRLSTAVSSATCSAFKVDLDNAFARELRQAKTDERLIVYNLDIVTAPELRDLVAPLRRYEVTSASAAYEFSMNDGRIVALPCKLLPTDLFFVVNPDRVLRACMQVRSDAAAAGKAQSTRNNDDDDDGSTGASNATDDVDNTDAVVTKLGNVRAEYLRARLHPDVSDQAALDGWLEAFALHQYVTAPERQQLGVSALSLSLRALP